MYHAGGGCTAVGAERPARDPCTLRAASAPERHVGALQPGRQGPACDEEARAARVPGMRICATRPLLQATATAPSSGEHCLDAHSCAKCCRAGGQSWHSVKEMGQNRVVRPAQQQHAGGMWVEPGRGWQLTYGIGDRVRMDVLPARQRSAAGVTTNRLFSTQCKCVHHCMARSNQEPFPALEAGRRNH